MGLKDIVENVGIFVAGTVAVGLPVAYTAKTALNSMSIEYSHVDTIETAALAGAALLATKYFGPKN